MLVELSVMEQRYQAVLAVVQDGWKVVEVADRLGVSRQTIHNWIARYEQGSLALADRPHPVSSCRSSRTPPARGIPERPPATAVDRGAQGSSARHPMTR